MRWSLALSSAVLVLASTSASGQAAIQYEASKFKPVPTDGQATKSVACPNGTQVVSGGAFTSGGSVDDEVAESYPSDGRDADDKADDAWTASINAGASQESMRTYAVCSGSLPLSYRRNGQDLAPGIQQINAGCPNDRHALGGGISLKGSSTRDGPSRLWFRAGPPPALGESGSTAFTTTPRRRSRAPLTRSAGRRASTSRRALRTAPSRLASTTCSSPARPLRG